MSVATARALATWCGELVSLTVDGDERIHLRGRLEHATVGTRQRLVIVLADVGSWTFPEGTRFSTTEATLSADEPGGRQVRLERSGPRRLRQGQAPQSP